MSGGAGCSPGGAAPVACGRLGSCLCGPPRAPEVPGSPRPRPRAPQATGSGALAQRVNGSTGQRTPTAWNRLGHPPARGRRALDKPWQAYLPPCAAKRAGPAHTRLPRLPRGWTDPPRGGRVPDWRGGLAVQRIPQGADPAMGTTPAGRAQPPPGGRGPVQGARPPWVARTDPPLGHQRGLPPVSRESRFSAPPPPQRATYPTPPTTPQRTAPPPHADAMAHTRTGN